MVQRLAINAKIRLLFENKEEVELIFILGKLIRLQEFPNEGDIPKEQFQFKPQWEISLTEELIERGEYKQMLSGTNDSIKLAIEIECKDSGALLEIIEQIKHKVRSSLVAAGQIK